MECCATDKSPIVMLPYPPTDPYDSPELTALLNAGYLLLTMTPTSVTSDIRIIAGINGPILVLPNSATPFDSGEITAIKTDGYLVLEMPTSTLTTEVKLILGLA